VFLHVEFHLRKCDLDEIYTRSLHARWRFWFRYDDSIDNYKIVAFYQMINEVRVFSLGDNVWRHIQSFHVVPFMDISTRPLTHLGINAGVYVRGTVNWLAIRNVCPCDFELESITIDQFVINSLDLSTETYYQFLPLLVLMK